MNRSRMSPLALAAIVWALVPAMAVADVDYPITIHRDNGLANVFARLSSGQPITIAYLGGSITEAQGYRDNVTNWFKGLYPGRITEINAGWGGTGSLIGALRVADDVLSHDPDLVFIEFAVNDLPEDPVYFIERNTEGLVRQIREHNPMADVAFVETIAWYNEPAYLAGNYPASVQAHYNVADVYGCPSINVGWALYEQVLAGTPWTNLAPDRVHPNSTGSQIYSGAIISYLNAERARHGTAAAHAMPALYTNYPVMAADTTALANVTPLPAGWTIYPDGYGGPGYIQSSTVGSTISATFTGPAVALRLFVGPDSGTFSVSIDGGPFAPASPFNPSYLIRWAMPIAKTLSFGTHRITFRVDSGIVRLAQVEGAMTEPAGPAPTDVNLARDAASVTADTVYGPGFEATRACDGQLSTKWTSTNAASTHWLVVDLGLDAAVSAFVVRYAGAGGEPTTYNAESFVIESAPSAAGPWTLEFNGANPSQQSVMTFAYAVRKTLRYVRLRITDAGIDQYARVPEFEVWGPLPPIVGDVDDDGDVDLSDFGFFQLCFNGPNRPLPFAGCEVSDFDADGDVDLSDFGRFLACFNGPNRPAPVSCRMSLTP